MVRKDPARHFATARKDLASPLGGPAQPSSNGLAQPVRGARHPSATACDRSPGEWCPLPRDDADTSAIHRRCRPGLHRPPVVVLAHPRHGVVGRDTAHDGQDRHGRARAADPAAAGDLDPLDPRPRVRLAQCGHGPARSSRAAGSHARPDPPVLPAGHPRGPGRAGRPRSRAAATRRAGGAAPSPARAVRRGARRHRPSVSSSGPSLQPREPGSDE